jgi:hypothetical protein
MVRQYIRKEVHTDDIQIDQKPNIPDNTGDREDEIVIAEQLPDKKFLDELAFNEEPVTIRLEPSSDKNAPTMIPAWNNGKGCEVWDSRLNQWQEWKYIPVGKVLTVKRKYVATFASAKYDSVSTVHGSTQEENPRNEIKRFTSAVASFSVIEDRNPRGVEWLNEIRRRNF